MSEMSPNKSVSSLVQSILADDGAPESPSVEPAPPAATDNDTVSVVDPLAELIESFFATEAVADREVILDTIAQFPGAAVETFLQAVAINDQDDTIQTSAYGLLARDGDPVAQDKLRENLQDPTDLETFRQALEILAEIDGPNFFETALTISRDDERDPAEQHLALEALETLDRERAMAEYTQRLCAMQTASQIDEDVVEMTALAFGRHDCSAGCAELERLQKLAVKRDDPALHDCLDEALALSRPDVD